MFSSFYPKCSRFPKKYLKRYVTTMNLTMEVDMTMDMVDMDIVGMGMGDMDTMEVKSSGQLPSI